MSNSRYPYTEAYDFIRSHVKDFSEVHDMVLPTVSRSQCAQMCHAIAPALGLTAEELARKIADHAGIQAVEKAKEGS
jgi:hypothetical protein